ncbi:HalOD1 output domain-containing protein [Halorussus aquaticus]|uniref:HalOD1 output domain-containing protein n=1 Tax=Halorussus aquaticus TaxID=2953748 RepID=A0ABD5PZ45_9EURY|nr:HalOD1 output domain-containing protein [Halorussus aquaticus]
MAITTPPREPDSMPVAERHHPPAASEPLSRTVFAALAGAEGVEPTDLDFELYDYLDPEALDALYRHSSSGEDWSVTFAVRDYEVRAESSGRVAVYEIG